MIYRAVKYRYTGLRRCSWDANAGKTQMQSRHIVWKYPGLIISPHFPINRYPQPRLHRQVFHLFTVSNTCSMVSGTTHRNLASFDTSASDHRLLSAVGTSGSERRIKGRKRDPPVPELKLPPSISVHDDTRGRCCFRFTGSKEAPQCSGMLTVVGHVSRLPKHTPNILLTPARFLFRI